MISIGELKKKITKENYIQNELRAYLELPKHKPNPTATRLANQIRRRL